MNEADIAAKLANNLRVEQEVEPSADTAPTIKESAEKGYALNDSLDELSTHRIFDFFDVALTERQQPEYQRMMNTIVEWANQRGAREYFEIIREARHMLQTLGSRDFKTLYKYAKLDMVVRRNEEEIRALYG